MSVQGLDSPLGVVAIVFFLVVLGLYIWSLHFAYVDAEARGKSGCLVTLIVAFLSWPVGLLVWLVFRPETLAQRTGALVSAGGAGAAGGDPQRCPACSYVGRSDQRSCEKCGAPLPSPPV